MAKIAASLKLSAEQVDKLMGTETRCRIATVGPGQHINLTPMTFGWAAGKVYIFGRGQKIANLRRDSNATVLVDVGDAWKELKGIMLYGQATVLESSEEEDAEPDLHEARINLGTKHKITENAQPVPYPASASGRSRRWVVFTPQKIVTWNNENL